jgi:hypothetical protein
MISLTLKKASWAKRRHLLELFVNNGMLESRVSRRQWDGKMATAKI